MNNKCIIESFNTAQVWMLSIFERSGEYWPEMTDVIKR